MRITVVVLLFAFILTSCSQQSYLQKEIVRVENLFQNHSGFMLYDPETRKTLFSYHSDKYFTPASNTKIFTFYTALQLLGDSIPAVKYIRRNDSLIFWGTGDPSFLNPNVYQNARTLEFLKGTNDTLFLNRTLFQSDFFGPGWAWDDYPYRFSAERTPFPIYGNYVTTTLDPSDSVAFNPSLFSNFLIRSSEIHEDGEIIREKDSNALTFYPGKTKTFDTLDIPFHYSQPFLITLMQDTLGREIHPVELLIDSAEIKTLYSIPSDSLYRVMMQDSDNLVAEQLLLLCAGTISDTLKIEIAINYAKENFLFDLPDEPIWIDGSGLSRYNLFTPRTIIRVWEKIYLKVPKERLYHLIASGGKNGTLENYFKADEPYVHGKTGTLSNQHSLSGFIETKKGKTLIFCWMNNNYPTSSIEVKRSMETVLENIRDHF